MFGRIVKRNHLIEVYPAVRDVSCADEGNAHDAVRDQERNCRALGLCTRQELRRMLADRVTIERH